MEALREQDAVQRLFEISDVLPQQCSEMISLRFFQFVFPVCVPNNKNASQTLACTVSSSKQKLQILAFIK
mgnify:CR=1 FL=1